MNPRIEMFFDQASATFTYVVIDESSKCAAIIDPVWGYDDKSGRTSTTGSDLIIDLIKREGLTLEWILETHAHADHLTSARYLKDTLGGKTAIGYGITQVQKIFKGIFNIGDELKANGEPFDQLFADDDTFQIGNLTAKVLATPGHTNDSVTYLIGDNAFVGDTLFMPDAGTARCDFPGGDAATLYESIQRLYTLPDNTKLYMCHDYQPNERELLYVTTVKAQREANIHANKTTKVEDFVCTREARDATLDMPRLILPAVQVNIRAGNLPVAEANGIAYLKVPVNLL